VYIAVYSSEQAAARRAAGGDESKPRQSIPWPRMSKRQKIGLPFAAPEAAGTDALNLAHGVDGVVFVDDHTGPSRKAILVHGSSKLEVYLFGAHTTSWQSDGNERLWMSGLSKLDGSAPIRGGVS
jgi:hypothetical protein